MANLDRSHRRRWRGAALGGPLQRACRFCLARHDGQARTSQIAEWCRPEIVYAGGKPTAIQIAKHARALGVAGFRSLKDTWADTTTPHGKLMVTVLGGLAEFERELIRARTGEGRVRAKARGVKFGRPRKMTRQTGEKT